MKILMFTGDPNVQDKTAYKELRVVSSEEMSLARQKGSEYFHNQHKLRSRQDLLDWGEKYMQRKFYLGKYLADYLKTFSARTVLGLGSGECFHEYAMKIADPEIVITATDFDPYVVEKVSEFLPEMDKVEMFDIKNGDFTRFQGQYDTILMIGVIYAFSNDEMVSFFKKVSSIGVSHILIITSYLSTSGMLRYLTNYIYVNNPLSYLIRRYILKRSMAPSGRFHGWLRSRGEFVKLMKKAGTVKLYETIKLKPPISETEILIHIVPI